ncbi:MAG: hypothetical protein A3J07_02420 [Candidatus Doudnabacteria bacterium RIFCSPLOWO2_02_FULL_49_13]|uniref:DUF218 domain-containing protein n=1 Tax=Candidatus Doudnabacteria bacterium RIFCSPHIGHO2_12_FULL_48_16 TaxID=1817838 RepID=A0A1F5PKU2_9BACT|nr:MAG: hypothetical protein A3B77_03405 [Candidatus Doudnabacteria bacterium RIFCSPHIGHO2_02_FULL_49_24]OGE89168.1 MAG: hypothetical protein A2760_02150 [Candidatus Doudnabacteria bacterium RIFCSPHIGHO2_01_FULL_50_67]OGE90536.1 MAG: hypothetical protein A3E29_01935 [Candidatus Doudnabacteria bacterium RIFCSPHIGHO2_12_FULL_48_16]OGE97194.1 MAG: hypothetical protein A2990_01180 [Candidatus Doudnabacteria bacterium RIFCSPLOWO2_01_FULL_49_40]OGF02928.1 MAG: hypothetical protein A3J07_02420 [Candid
MKYDAILVLGRGFKPKNFLPRLKLAGKLYKSQAAPKILLSGYFWGGLKQKPKISEARVMMGHLLRWGVKKHDILLEEKSLNTIGNFYFSKKLFLKPLKLRKLAIITSKDHMPKAKYLAKKILGRAFDYKFIDDKSVTRYYVTKGHFGVGVMKMLFKKVKDGDAHAAARVLAGDQLYLYHYKNNLRKILK